MNPNIENGFKPYGMYNGGDVDSVSLTNQNLVFHGPLWGYPQRGTLSQNYLLLYNAKNWKIFKWCNNQTGTCNEKWQWNGNNVSLTADEGASVAWTWYSIGGHVFTGGTWDGATHQMATNNAGGIESVDASGIYYDGNLNLTGVLRLRNGDRGSEDTNGNLISTASGPGVLDTLGRQLGGGASSSDTTGCTGWFGGITITNFPGPGGTTRMVKLCQVGVSLQTNFHFWDNNYDIYVQEANVVRVMLQDAILYNGISWATSPKWNFQYSDRDPGDPSNINYGNLTQVTLPTGGTITYTYRTLDLCWQSPSPLQVSRGVATRTVDAQDGTGPHTWSYTPWGLGANSGIVVTDPAANDVVHTVTGFGCSYYVTQSQSYQGSHTTGTLLKTVNTDYSWIANPEDINGDGTTTAVNVLPIRITTTWPNGQVSKIEKDYDTHLSFNFAGTNYTGSYGNVVEERVFDYGNGVAGPLLRRTDYTYLETNNLLDRVTSAITYDGSGNQVAKTTYGYDQYSLVSSGITTQRDTSVPNPGVRGNRTAVNQWLNTTGGMLTTTTTYYDTGMPYQVTDPGGHTTTYSYSSSNAGAYVTQTNFPDTGSPAVHHIVSGGYDFNTGLLTSFTDQNSQTSSYGYEILGRIASASFPDLGQTTFTYNDTPGSLNVEGKGKIDNSGHWTDAYVKFDGLGRPTRKMTANAESVPWDQVDTCYEARGLASFMSYPYQGHGLSDSQVCSGAGDSFAYDALKRTLSVTHSDTTVINTAYTGAATQVTDEGNGTSRVQRISQVDGLGRLRSVCEVTGTTLIGITPTPAACGQAISATGFLTTYQYDGLGNLTSVSQGGLNPRTFAYDSLSRLTSATNPESGTTSYTYNSDSLLYQRTRPAPNQTNPSVTETTTYTYDPLHRLTGQTYSPNASSTPTVTIAYDQSAAFGVALGNTIGRKSSEFVTGLSGNLAGAVYSYDQMGRVVTNSQCTPQNCNAPAVFPITYTYDAVGDVVTATNGAGTTLTSQYNIAPRLTALTSSLSDSNHPGTLLSGVHYNAAGSLLSGSLGNGLSENRGYDGRLRLNLIAVGSVYNVAIPSNGYAPNGDILAANDSVNGNWTYTYDNLNRLLTASATGQSYTYDYDRFGNRWHQNGPHPSMLSFDANNRIATGNGVTYDAAGNVTNDGYLSYTYDDENRITAVGGGATASYLYDAGGLRIRRTTAAGSVDLLYDLQGRVVSEVSSTGILNRGEIFAGGRHLATYRFSSTYFNHADWLGTERVRSDVNGGTHETCTSLPFGDWFTCAGTDDPSPNHFTGKERDGESGLDNFGARYFSSALGRFMSRDPKMISAQRMVDPQQWNMYSYSRNNPTSYYDPDGREVRALDAGALNHIRQTLPASIRSSVVADKNGVISSKALSGVKSNDANFQTLKHMVDAKGVVQVSTGPTATNNAGKTAEFKYESSETVKADLQSKGITPTEGKDYSTNFSGLTYGANESKSGNIEVHVSDGTGQAAGLSDEEQTVTMGHELYVHGDRLLDGRPADHENSRNGEVNKETHEVEERTRKNAKEKDPQ